MDTVICVFHASVTLLSSFTLRGSASVDQVCVEIDRALWPLLRDFGPQFMLTKFTQAPGSIEAFDFLALKTLPRVPQEFEVSRHGNDVLVVVPLLPNLEIPKNLVRCVRFERPSDQGPEPLFGSAKIEFLYRDIQEPKTIELAKQRLIDKKMRRKVGWPFESRIHVTEGDHRGGYPGKEGRQTGETCLRNNESSDGLA